jgi:hypothetical protein
LHENTGDLTFMSFAFWHVRTPNSRWLRLLVEGGKGEDVTGAVQHSGSHQCIIMRRTASDPNGAKPPLTRWAESLVFAGSSALLLLIANLFPDYWYFSLFALTPFLYRIIQATPGESLRLALLFGLSHFGASAVSSLAVSPFSTVLKLSSGTALFAVFGWSVGWARQRWGFNPSLVAVLWVGLETGLLKLGFAHGLLGEAEFSHPFLHSLAGLVGLLAASAIIVLLNSLLILAMVKVIEVARTSKKRTAEDERMWRFFFTRNLVAEKIYLVPEGRAPPFLPQTVCVRVRL